MVTKKKIGWKKLKSRSGAPLLATLEILGKTRGGGSRFAYDKTYLPRLAGGGGRGEKRRASKVKVLKIEKIVCQYPAILGKTHLVGYSPTAGSWNCSGNGAKRMQYRVGKIVWPKNGFDKSNEQCSSGIHFFFSKSAAITY